MKEIELFYNLALTALKLLPAEAAHNLTINALHSGYGPKIEDNNNFEIDLAGLKLKNPIGLAAGFDKNAVVPDVMLNMGFGFVECGTVTPLAQAGNPKPRLFRLEEDKAIINAMGFNNDGLDLFVKNLRNRSHLPGIVGANIGANKDSTDRINDYVLGLRRVWLHSSYVTINISSPNTQGLRDLQSRMALEDLLSRIFEAKKFLKDLHGAKPIFLKVAPDIGDADVSDISELAQKYEIDGIIVSNTTISRPTGLISNNRNQSGGLSGRPLFELSTAKLRDFKSALGDTIPLIGVGGISSGDDAVKKLEAGATAIQLYSALTYGGIGLLKEIKDAVAEYLTNKK